MRRFFNAMIWLALAIGVYCAVAGPFDPAGGSSRAGSAAGHSAGCSLCRTAGPALPDEITRDNVRFSCPDHDPDLR